MTLNDLEPPKYEGLVIFLQF